MSEKTSLTPIRAAIYARISSDRTGEGLGVDRQTEDCRDLARRLGWAVANVYTDNDISAYSGKVRPRYRQMLQDVKDGNLDAILAWHPDRLHRRVMELEEFAEVVNDHATKVQTVSAGELDLSTPTGIMVARMLGAAAQHEVAQTRSRLLSKKKAMAAAGEYRGGPRPYGYEKDGVTVRESEAEVVRRATRQIIAGRTLAAVARELNEKDLTTSTGKPWTYSRLRDVLVRPRNAGKLNRGRHGRGELDITGDAKWPAILGYEEWLTVYKFLTDDSRRKQNGNDTRWLGSGIYVCGKCGEPLRVAPHGGKASQLSARRYLYRCSAQAHLTVSTAPTDSLVRAVIAEYLRDPRIARALDDQSEHTSKDRQKRTELEKRRETIENDYAKGIINGGAFNKANKTVQSQIDEIDSRLSVAMRRSVSSPVINAADPVEAFMNAPMDVQRFVLTTLIRVEIAPSPYRGSRWSSERVKITPAE